MIKRKYFDKESFVAYASKLHKNKYIYDKFVYNGKNARGEIICPLHGSFWQTPSVHTRKERPSGCPICAKEKKQIGFSVFLERARKINGQQYLYDKKTFKNMSSKMRIFCKKHKIWFEQTPKNHVHSTNPTKCPICAKEQVISKNRQTFQDFKKKAMTIHNNKYEYFEEGFVNATKKVKIRCKKCDIIFQQTPHSHLTGKGCPYCKTSKMEEKTRLLLKKYNVPFVEQKTFEWLKYKKKQYLDFYLPNHNIAIECQGEQHYRPVDFSHMNNIAKANENLIINQARDKNKQILCEKHGIVILYISFNENLEEKLTNLLKENNII